MKKYLAGIFAVVFGMAAFAMAAPAATSDQLLVTVPYDFVVGDKTLPAGTYRVSRVSTTDVGHRPFDLHPRDIGRLDPRIGLQAGVLGVDAPSIPTRPGEAETARKPGCLAEHWIRRRLGGPIAGQIGHDRMNILGAQAVSHRLHDTAGQGRGDVIGKAPGQPVLGRGALDRRIVAAGAPCFEQDFAFGRQFGGRGLRRHRWQRRQRHRCPEKTQEPQATDVDRHRLKEPPNPIRLIDVSYNLWSHGIIALNLSQGARLPNGSL